MPVPVHELLARIQIEPRNLSQQLAVLQLAVLRLAGLVEQRRQGGEVIYSIAMPEVPELLLAARRILQTKLVDSKEMVDEITRSEAMDLSTTGRRAASRAGRADPAEQRPVRR